jgi:ADP-ribose pyrophosphatase YjhB (NUDIX family)
MSPTLSTSFEYEGNHILLDWYEIGDKASIPDLPWQQVYVIGNCKGKVPLVTNAHSPKPYNLPGGRTEAGETLEQTMTRELVEECNMRVLSWEPIGYQMLTEPSGARVAQFRAYALLEPIGEFTHDPGGAVIANTLVNIDQLEKYIEYGEVGVRMQAIASDYIAAV